MQIKHTALYYALLLLLIMLLACCQKKDKPASQIQEGFIEYRMTYKGDSMRGFKYELLPKKMTMWFKDNNTRNRISDLAGVVAFTHIKNHEQGTYTTLVDIFNNQYKYIEQSDKPSIFFQSRPEMEIERTSTMKEIAGCKCRKYIIHRKNTGQEDGPFAVYATQDIEIEGFTDLTPYQSIDGVLLKFKVQLYGLPVKLEATEVSGEEVSPKKFSVPSGYKRVNKQSMKKIIELLK